MSRRRIEASEIFSIPESASLDTMLGSYPGSVEASLSDQDGDLYLRIASNQSKDVEMTEEDIQKKIKEWKTHTKEHATNAGFRKANRGRGPMDPRRFALQLAEAARLNANQYGSRSLLRLAKQLKWVAGQERGVAARALAKIAAPVEEEARRRDQAGMPFIQKPPDQAVPPSSEFNEESQLTPGEPVDYGQDQSWRARESGRVAKEKEIDSELLTMARDFLQDYKSRNSLYDEDLLDQLQDPNVFESWLLDLDSKGVNPDPGQLDEAWNAAMNEIAEGSGTSLTDELGEEKLSPVSAKRGGETIQQYSAPGGDWFNTVINLHENPVMDRYLRTMKDKREGRSRVSRKIEVESEIAEAVDQCLDHFAGDMLPGEISSGHVQQFLKDRFPDTDWKKVYEAIQQISDPKKRHEDDPKERTNQEASKVSAGFRDDATSYSHSDLVDLVEFFKGKGVTAKSITPEDIAGYLGIGKKSAVQLLPRIQRLFEKPNGLTSSRKSGLRRQARRSLTAGTYRGAIFDEDGNDTSVTVHYTLVPGSEGSFERGMAGPRLEPDEPEYIDIGQVIGPDRQEIDIGEEDYKRFQQEIGEDLNAQWDSRESALKSHRGRRAKTNRRAFKGDSLLLSRLTPFNGTTFADQRSALAHGITPEDWAAAKDNGWLVRDPAGGMALEIQERSSGQGAPQAPQTQSSPQVPQTSKMLGDWSNPLTSIIRSNPGSTVVLKNGQKVQLNPLYPVDMQGKTINLLDGNQASLSLVQQVLDPQGRPIKSSRRTNGRSGLKHYREVCACCRGTGEKGDRCCGQCQGSGQADVSAFDEDLDRKEKIASRLGTLLLVSVDAGNRRVSAADRQELARVARTRVAAKGAPLVLKHSAAIMKTLVENGIPYRTASYQHPRYKK